MPDDLIEAQIEIVAPISKVWRALTDSSQFGAWFGVKLDKPFVCGATIGGKLTIPGYEHYQWEATVKEMESESMFSFTWHPYAIDLKVDYSKEIPTLVEFELAKTPTGTLLLLTESGFNNVPQGRRSEAYRMHVGGWEQQLQNIKQFVEE